MDILLIHTNCQVQRTIEGKDVLFLESASTAEDDDKILSLPELSLIRRKIFLISENPLPCVPELPENVFLLTPLQGILSCCSIEAALYQLALKKNQRPGKIEDIIRTQSQVFTKFIKSAASPLLFSDPTIGPYTSCPLCFHLLLTHLMTVYFYTWMHRKGLDSKKYPNSAIFTLLRHYPTQLQSPTEEVLQFLDSLVN